MARAKPIEIFMPPNMLKAKVGGRISGVDIAAVRRAQQALADLKIEFDEWIRADVTALVVAYEAYGKTCNAERRDKLYRASHDLRGQALTFEYPLVARVATSLCNLLEGHSGNVPMALVSAHVNAIRVIIRQNIKDTSDKITLALTEELGVQVREFLDTYKTER